MKVGESSTIVAFRALVMLACLIVAPLAAIFGSAFPDLVRSILIDPFLNRKDEGAPGALQVAQTPPFSAPAVSFDSNSGASSGGGGNFANNGPPPAWQPTGMTVAQSSNAPPLSVSSAAQPMRPASGYAPLATAGGPSSDSSANGFSGGGGPRPAPANLARFDAPADLGSAPANPSPIYGAARGAGNEPAPRFSASGAAAPLSASAPARSPGGETEQFGWIEKRLRDAGATYYLLETWGPEGDLYRFHCKMAVANNPNYTRHFEATDRDKLQAMSRVLEQIEAWRAGRLP